MKNTVDSSIFLYYSPNKITKLIGSFPLLSGRLRNLGGQFPYFQDLSVEYSEPSVEIFLESCGNILCYLESSVRRCIFAEQSGKNSFPTMQHVFLLFLLSKTETVKFH